MKSWNKQSNKELNAIEKVTEPMVIRRYTMKSAGQMIKEKFCKGGDVMAVMGHSIGLNSDYESSFHGSLLIVTRKKDIFIFDPQVCTNQNYWRKINGLKEGLGIGIKREVRVCHGDQSGTLDCLQRVLKVGGLLLGGQDFRRTLRFKTFAEIHTKNC